MKPIDIALVVIVLAVVAVAARRFVGTARGTRDCCSGAATGATPSRKQKAVAVTGPADTDPTHYPYEARLGIGGMTCEHCVATVTSALNAMGDTWATVELAGGQALLRSKRPAAEKDVRAAVEAAGYRLVSFEAVAAA